MAGAPWQFTLLPDSINTVTITDGSTTVTVNRGSGSSKTEDTFLTGAFAETTIVTISATGYNDLTNITVGDTNLVMTPIQTKPETLYAWTGILNANNVTVYTETANPTSSDKIYYEDGTEMTGTTYLNTRVNSIVSSDGSTLTIDYTDLRP